MTQEFDKHINNYLINIFERYSDLKKSNKQELDNYDLCKIFEYYTCIKLSEEYNKLFYEYNDIDPTFKEQNKMSRNDTGIDCCDLLNTIVQCKLRSKTLTWGECGTFFGSQNIFSQELGKTIVRWDNLIIARNSDCELSENLLERYNFKLFIDRPYSKNRLIEFCEDLIANPPKYPTFNENFKLRDYQIEAIELIKQSKNTIINLPTGTGKNSVIIYSMEDDKKYLILVPRIILMEQLKQEIIKHKPHMKNNIQLIGDTSNTFNQDKLITICVFNSVHIVENYCLNFNKIYIDEAHHINKPAIYYEDNDGDTEEDLNDGDTEEDLNDGDNLEYYDEIKKYNSYTKKRLFDELFCEISENLKNDMNKYLNLEFDEDEVINTKNYIQIIKDLFKYENNVYLSATIDQSDNFEYFSKDIRTMIDMDYLSDYQIHIPIFSDDPTNKNICEHLLASYRSIIIYCNSQKEGQQINKLMNELQPNSSEYIDCNTQKKLRNSIIDKYKNGELPFLVNVRILVEGFDAPITKGVCFLHLPTNKTTLIQIIGRALRLHPTKTIANIILPYSLDQDGNNICNFLKVMAKNDSRVKKSFESKKLGGYISIEGVDNEEENDSIEFKYNMIYNSMGIIVNGQEIWMTRLEEVKKYIDDNGKRPSSHDKDNKIKQLGKWIHHQQTNYSRKENIMKDEIICNQWINFISNDKYHKYFQSKYIKWYDFLNQLVKYIDTNNKRPSKINKNTQIKELAEWSSTQKKNYKNKTNIMKNKIIYNKWSNFINNEKYNKYFISNEEKWINMFNKLVEHININNKKPSETDKNTYIKELGLWTNYQQNSYKTKKNMMKNEQIYNKWSEFINDNKYNEYFKSNEDKWNDSYNKVIEYINKNNKKPSGVDHDIEIKQLGLWIGTQKQKYKKKIEIMKNEEIYKKWSNFINDDKYKKYLQSKEDTWIDSFNQIIKYINNKRPCQKNINIQTRQLGE